MPIFVEKFHVQTFEIKHFIYCTLKWRDWRAVEFLKGGGGRRLVCKEKRSLLAQQEDINMFPWGEVYGRIVAGIICTVAIGSIDIL